MLSFWTRDLRMSWQTYPDMSQPIPAMLPVLLDKKYVLSSVAAVHGIQKHLLLGWYLELLNWRAQERHQSPPTCKDSSTTKPEPLLSNKSTSLILCYFYTCLAFLYCPCSMFMTSSV